MFVPNALLKMLFGLVIVINVKNHYELSTLPLPFLQKTKILQGSGMA